MLFPLIFGHAVFAEHAPGLRNALFVHLLSVSAHQVMPQQQIFTLTDQAVGAGGGQPLKLVGLSWRELNTVGDVLAPVAVISAAAGFQVQQFAGDARVINAAIVFILKLLQAAQAAAIAQRFPLVLIQLLEGFAFPEGFDFGGHGEGT